VITRTDDGTGHSCRVAETSNDASHDRTADEQGRQTELFQSPRKRTYERFGAFVHMSDETSTAGVFGGLADREGLISLRWLAALAAVAFLGVTWYLYQTRVEVAMIGAGIATGFGTYALLGTGRGSLREALNGLSVDSTRLSRGLASGFFLASAVSMVTLTWGYYTKPIAYYLAIAAAGAILFLRIALTDATQSNVILAVLFGLNTFGSNQIAFPLGMRGPDGGYHIRLVEYIMESGQVIPGGVTYAGFPGQHLLSATTGISAGLSSGVVYVLIGTVAMTLGLLLTYSVGRRVLDARYALIAMLVYASMSYVIYRGGHPTQQAHILPMMFLLFLATLYLYYRPNTRESLLFMLFSVVLIATHHHSSFQAGGMLVALYLGYRLFGPLEWVSTRLLRSKVRRLPSRAMATGGRGARLMVLFGTAFAAHIVFTSGYFRNMVGHVLGFAASLNEETRRSLASSGRFAEVQTEQFLINTTGEGILLGLAVIGGLACLVYLSRTLLMMVVWLAVAGVLAALGTVIDWPFLIPQRIYVTAQMTAIGFLAAFGVVVLLGRGVDSRVRSVTPVAVLTVVVFALVFFSASSTIAGIETSPFNTNVGYGLWYDVVEEERSEEFLAQVGINPDAARGGAVTANGSMDYSSIDEGIISVRHHRLSSGSSLASTSGIASATKVFPDSPTAPLTDDNKIYSSEQVELYHRP